MSGRVTPRRQYLAMYERDYNRLTQVLNWLYEAVDHAVDAWLVRPRIGDVKPGTGEVTFKPREHFRANGTPKHKRSLAAAQRFVENRPDTDFYRCSVCDAYHVGHKVKNRSIARLAVA